MPAQRRVTIPFFIVFYSLKIEFIVITTNGNITKKDLFWLYTLKRTYFLDMAHTYYKIRNLRVD